MHIEHIWPRFQLEELFNGDLLHVRHDMRVEIKGGADLGVEYELAKSSSIRVERPLEWGQMDLSHGADTNALLL